MHKNLALGGAGVLLLAALLWLATGRSSGYRFDADEALYHRFSGERALGHVRDLVNFGPRPAGSDALEASRQYLERHLQELGWATRRQTFTEETPVGPVTFVNLRARHPATGGDEEALWARPTPVLMGSHYDTKLYREFKFIGANDGGSSTGALLEMARITASQPPLAASLELVFFDGEEAFGRNITDTDGLYGSRYYARQARRLDAGQRPQIGLILDMIGDRDLNIGVPNDSPYGLYQALMSAARDLGHQQHFGIHPSAILDDHVPLNLIGIPTLDIIDLDYKPWHTAGDTLDQVSAESLRIVGSTTLLLVEKYLLGKGL